MPPRGSATNRQLQETTPRFVLALLALLVTAIAIAESMWYSVYNRHAYDVVMLCHNGTDRARCDAEEASMSAWTVAWAPVVFAAAVVLAAVSSALRRRFRTPVPSSAAALLAGINERAAASVGTHPLPLLWRPARPVATARADGIVKRYVEVGPTWLSLALGDEDNAAAVLRHEYAHHRSRDVIGARVTISTSIVVSVMAIALVTMSFSSERAVSSVMGIAHALAALAVALLARLSVLRAREFDADRSAAATDSAGLKRALSSDRAATGVRRWLTAVSHHPTARRRIQFVDDPGLLNRPRVSDALMVGLTASVGAPVLTRLIQQWSTGGWGLYAAGIAWAGIGAVIGCWLVAVSWNQAVVTSRRSPVPFAVALAGALFVGNVIFQGAYDRATPVVPGHFVAVGCLIGMAIALPLVALWILQLFDAVLLLPRRHAGFGGMVALAAGLAVAMVAALMGLLGHITNLALLESSVAQGADLSDYARRDLDSPQALIDLTTTWNYEWMGVLLPTVAVAGALSVLVACRRAHVFGTHRSVLALLSPIAAAMVAGGSFWLVNDLFDVIARGKRANWFAAQQTLLFVPLFVGVAIAGICAFASMWLRPPRVVLAAGAAALASLLAAVFISVIVYGDLRPLWAMAATVAPVAVFGSLIMAALTGRRPPSPSRVTAAALSGAIVFALIGFGCVRAPLAVVSDDVDSAHYQSMLARATSPDGKDPTGPLALAWQKCTSRPSFDPRPIGTLIDDYSGALWRPATPAIKAIHVKLLDALQHCHDANTRAHANGWAMLTPSEVQDSAKRFGVFYAAITAKFGSPNG